MVLDIRLFGWPIGLWASTPCTVLYCAYLNVWGMIWYKSKVSIISRSIYLPGWDFFFSGKAKKDWFVWISTGHVSRKGGGRAGRGRGGGGPGVGGRGVKSLWYTSRHFYIYFYFYSIFFICCEFFFPYFVSFCGNLRTSLSFFFFFFFFNSKDR